MSTVHIAAGLVLAVAASACFETGYVVQAGESRAEDGGGASSGLLGRLIQRPRWVGGTALVLVGTLAQLGALALAPVAVVQPALVLGLALLVMLAERRLGEVVGRIDRVAVAAAGVGAVLVAIGGQAGAVTDPGHRNVALGVLGGALLLAAAGGFATGRSRPLVAAAGAGDAWAVLAAKIAVDALTHGRIAMAAVWAGGAIAAGLVGLAAEMAALQRLPATTVGPLVLAAQIAIPVLLAPSVVGEHWGTAGLVVAGTALATGAAVALGRRRETLAGSRAGGAPSAAELPGGAQAAHPAPRERAPRSARG